MTRYLLPPDRVKGTILAWNHVTLENTVLVGQTRMANLPVLGVAGTASYGVGTVVDLVQAGSSWAVLGREG